VALDSVLVKWNAAITQIGFEFAPLGLVTLGRYSGHANPSPWALLRLGNDYHVGGSQGSALDTYLVSSSTIRLLATCSILMFQGYSRPAGSPTSCIFFLRRAFSAVRGGPEREFLARQCA
jgi:hypothetical protein